MVSRKILFGKLGISAFRAVESATAFCKLRGNPYVELVHWLHQVFLAVDTDFHRIFSYFGISAEEVDAGLSAALKRLPGGAGAVMDFSPRIELAIERAWLVATLECNQSKVRTGHLLSGLLQTPELRRELLEICPEFKRIPHDQIQELYGSILKESPEARESAHDRSGLVAAEPGEASGALSPESSPTNALGRYCADLTAQARAGQIDPVIGREQEIRCMIDILLRRRQNNPLLTGEAGVGKTAVVEGLALAVANKKVPPSLASIRLLSLDVGALLAGASMKGEFESRLKAVIEEAVQSPQPIVLFVDEVHTLIGAGGTAGTGDAANLLKPALARGGLRTIGATTWSEYKKHIEKDAALTRRFQVLQVEEPSEEQAIRMLRGVVSNFEQHHGVLILDAAIRAAVTFAHRYIPARQLPDKAISLLDTACARVALSMHTPPPELQGYQRDLAALQTEEDLLARQVRLAKAEPEGRDEVRLKIEQLSRQIEALEARWQGERRAVEVLLAKRMELLQSEDFDPSVLLALEAELQAMAGETPLVFPEVGEAVVASIVSEWTGIPVGRMLRDEIAALVRLDEQLEQRVVGQPEALRLMARRVQVARSGMADEKKPVGVFMLVGPSGVGKTETALSLAESLYGGEHNLITINMSEFQEAHTVSTLKGAPPGYVGYGEGGVLTEAVRRRPYSVVLLDEIEKAHHDVHELFFQVFDKGWMEDGEGRAIDFRNTVILLTSNVGSELLMQLCADKELMPDFAALSSALQPELRKVFPAAFLGRVSVVPYLPLQDEVIARIVDLQLSRVARRVFEKHGVAVEFSPLVAQHIVAVCNVAESGARFLIAYIEQQLLPRLSDIWLDSLLCHATPTSIELTVSEGSLSAQAIYSPHRLTATKE